MSSVKGWRVKVLVLGEMDSVVVLKGRVEYSSDVFKCPTWVERAVYDAIFARLHDEIE